MPGTIYTVASGKGGVGKTTTTVNLGVALWQEGNSVAVVDADLGMANLSAVLGLEPETTLHDVLAGETILEEAVVEAKGGDLLVVAGSRDLEGFAAANPQKLKDVLENLAARCDYVIVDTGAGLGYEDVLPLGLADAVILVSSADPASLGDTRKTAELADLVETPVMGVVVTRAVAGTDAEAIAAEIGAPLLGTIPEDSAVMEATVAGDPLASHAPKSDATAAYMELGRAVIEADDRPPREPAGDTDEVAAEDDAGADAGPTDPGPDEARGEANGAEGAAATEEREEATEDEPAVGEADPASVDPDASSDERADDESPETADGPEPGVDGDAEPAPATGESDDEAGDQEAGAAANDGSADDDSADEQAVSAADGDAADADPAADEDDSAEEGSGGFGGWLGRLFS